MLQFLNTEAAGAGGGLLVSILPFVVMIAALYFILWRPQQKQEKKDAEMRNSIEIGDEVTTIGGIIGIVAAIKDDTFVLETTSDRVKLRMRRSAIASVNKLDMGPANKDSKAKEPAKDAAKDAKDSKAKDAKAAK